ncbi:MAG: HEAT repeat domain-containing protein, partial [Melioribacteraceae bacterium]|nr:HEAT repeat domain-containing protein [Melioribacteraceae bacterium]
QDYNKYSDYILVALGQLGDSKKSTEYLLNKLQLNDFPFNTQAYDAIGKCGDSLTLEYLFESVNNDSSFSSAGFPLTLTSFHNRGVKNINTLPYLINQLSRSDISEDNLFQTLFALYRIGPSKDALPKLVQILNETHADSIIQYALNNLRKLNTFPNDLKLMTRLSYSESWNVRTEAASVLCYFPFQSFGDLKVYLSLIDDKNPNVSRTTATSLKNIGKNNVFSDSLKTYLEKVLNEDRLSKGTQGELFISYCSLYSQKLEDKIDEYEDYIDIKFLYRVLTNNLLDTDFNYDFLTDNIEDRSEIELHNLLPALLALQNRFLNEDEYAAIILKIMNGDKASSISIVCDGLKLPFIHHYQEMLQEIIIDQVFKYKN